MKTKSAQRFSALQKGFTLIELLIVIAILGILAAALLIAIDPAEKIKSAQDTSAIDKVTGTASKMEQWTVQTGSGGTPGTIPTAADLTSNSAIALPANGNGLTYNYYPDAANNYYVVLVSGLSSKKAKAALGAPNNVDRFMYSSQNGKTCYLRSTAATVTSATACP